MKKRSSQPDSKELNDLSARLLTEAEILTEPAVFLFTSVSPQQGTTTIANSVARILAIPGRTVVLATVGGNSHTSQSAKPVSPNDESLVSINLPLQLTDWPEDARRPRTWAPNFDLMLIDAPALTDFATRYLVPLANGVILVVQGEKVSVKSVTNARDAIERLHGRLLGAVLNRHRSRIPRFLERGMQYG